MLDVTTFTVLAWMVSLGEPNESLAVAIAEASNEEPLFAEPTGPAHTAAFLTAIAATETAFDMSKRGDNNRSFCAMQIHLNNYSTTPEGWTGEELERDPDKCVHAAMRVLRESFRMCHRNKNSERSAAYASGHCDAGLWAARRQYTLAEKLFKQEPP